IGPALCIGLQQDLRALKQEVLNLELSLKQRQECHLDFQMLDPCHLLGAAAGHVGKMDILKRDRRGEGEGDVDRSLDAELAPRGLAHFLLRNLAQFVKIPAGQYEVAGGDQCDGNRDQNQNQNQPLQPAEFHTTSSMSPAKAAGSASKVSTTPPAPAASNSSGG